MLANPQPFFDQIADPRRETKNKRHNLSDILTITLCSVLSGMDDWHAIAMFARAKEAWFKRFLALPNGIPSHDTFGRVFSLIDPNAFESAFIDWAQQSYKMSEALKQVAIDGKVVRRSHNGFSGGPLHLVHAWACEQKLIIGQQAVEGKSNEISAIPDVLSLFDLNGVTITIDAMGCQRSVVKQIKDGGGDYVLSLKGNQGKLHDEVRLLMSAQAQHNPEGDICDIEKDHGRIETRRIWVSGDIDGLEQKSKWAGLNSVVMIESIREMANKTTTERRCFISSHPADAKRLGQYIRQHWGIENSLHWVLDMAFNEDQSRARIGHAAENLAIIRRLSLNLLRHAKGSKLGVKNKRLQACCDDGFRESILQLSPIDTEKKGEVLGSFL